MKTVPISNTGNSRRQRGVSLVESLVALVVLSIGMLGIASLYVATLKANRTALVRTQAVNLITDIADRIRSNRAGKGAYSTTVETEEEEEGEEAEPEEPEAPAPTCLGANCTPEVLAKDDLLRWQATMVQTMPGGTVGTVEFVAVAGDAPDTFTITVSWPESGVTEQARLILEL